MPNATAIQVLIVEDHLIMSTALRLLLNSQEHLCVVGEASNREVAHEMVASMTPDIVLLDLFLTDGESLSLIPDVLSLVPKARVMVLTGAPDTALHRRALTLGATGLVLKEQPADVLLAAIECVSRGEVWIDKSLLAELMKTAPTPAASPSDVLAPLAQIYATNKSLTASSSPGARP